MHLFLLETLTRMSLMLHLMICARTRRSRRNRTALNLYPLFSYSELCLVPGYEYNTSLFLFISAVLSCGLIGPCSPI
ncbi:hypothetical protein BJX65DRAFT_247487 [Aspergillus insuetus]